MLQVVVFFALAFSILIALFAVQNTTPVSVSFLFWQVQGVAASVLVLVSALLGAGVMLLLGLAREVRQQLRHRVLRQQLRTAQDRVTTLETQQAAPITDVISPAALPATSDTTAAASTVPLPGADRGD